MPTDDDGDDDAPVYRAPLPPDDRLWRHPSEIAGLTASPAAPAGRGMPTRTWGIAAVSGLVGVVLTLGVVTATVGLGTTRHAVVERVAARPLGASFVSSSLPAGSADSVARTLRPSIARVITGTGTTGSAVLYRDDGYLLAAAATIGGAPRVTVVLDGAQLDGTVIGTDATTAIAVIHVDRTGLTPAVAQAEPPAVGSRAFAVAGSATSAPSVTAGVVAALRTHAPSSDGTVLWDLVQTDAPVEGAALGGALADERGVVVGVLAAARDDGAGGYAVPIGTAIDLADELVATGTTQHSWLGVEGNDLEAVTASSLAVEGGATVTRVAAGSPADVAGLQAGDVITAVAGTKVTSMSALVVELRNHDPGEAIEVEYWRAGQPNRCTATLTARS